MTEDKKKKKEKTPEEAFDEIKQAAEAENKKSDEANETNAENQECKENSEEINLKKAVDDANEKYMRLYADFDNFRKRSARERTEISLYAQSEIVEKLLPVIDNLERAVLSECTDSAFKEGVAMVEKQLKEALIAEGLSEISCEGEKFDPVRHYAVMTDNDPEIENDTVTQVLQKGYTLREKIIRPAMVKVNKK